MDTFVRYYGLRHDVLTEKFTLGNTINILNKLKYKYKKYILLVYTIYFLEKIYR